MQTLREVGKFLLVAALVPVFLLLAGRAVADTTGERRSFVVNPQYDILDRSNLSASLVQISDHSYVYVEDGYLDSLSLAGRAQVDQLLTDLAHDFDGVIYPRETAFWGSEANPGIDGDSRPTILVERLKGNTGGYFDGGNGYPKAQIANSNEREMVAINAFALGQGRPRVFLAHEFQHLISLNQKELIRHASEEIWLNELRSQYSITLDGYNDDYVNSDLKSRAQIFLGNPADSLTEWKNSNLDYATVTLFGEYLAQRFGSVILRDTLQSPLEGIVSIDDWLTRNGKAERFEDVFGEWAIAVWLNDYARDPRYGYANPNLSSLRVTPTETAALSYPELRIFQYSAKPWQPTWHRHDFIGLPASQAVKLDIDAAVGTKIYYVDNTGRAGFLSDPGYLTNPGNLQSVTLIPVNGTRTANFVSEESSVLMTVSFEYIDNGAVPSQLKDGSLIKRPHEPETYVIEGQYKRYLSPGAIKLYGHLDQAKAVAVDDKTFNSYISTNYIRPVNGKKVYAVWPDGTKHWLNMSAAVFSSSGRDWNAIFVVNELEANFYKTGPDITR